MSETKDTDREKTPRNENGCYRSPALAWISLALTVAAWLTLMFTDGYVAMAVAMAVAAAVLIVGFLSMRGSSRAIRNIAITAVIASMVLLVVLTAFIIVIKIGLQG